MHILGKSNSYASVGTALQIVRYVTFSDSVILGGVRIASRSRQVEISFPSPIRMNSKSFLTALAGIAIVSTIGYLTYVSMQPVTVGDKMMPTPEDSMMSSSAMMKSEDAMTTTMLSEATIGQIGFSR